MQRTCINEIHPMTAKPSTLLTRASLGVVLGAITTICTAQPYPRKPIRLVVGFTAGGSADVSARAVIGPMGRALGTSFVIENRGGAGGSVAAQLVAIGNPDGYTLLWGSVGALTINPLLEKNISYNATTDFTPVGLAMTFGNALIVRPDLPARTLGELVALAKERPGKLNYATQGMGSAGQLSFSLLRSYTGIDLVHVPFKGAGEIITNLIGGEVQVAFVSVTAARALGSERIRILAVTSLKRDPALPAVPSVAEAGIRNYDATFWYGLLAPARTPDAVVNKLNRALKDALSEPEAVKALAAQGLVPAAGSPGDYAALLRSDLAKWKKVIVGP